MRPRPTRDATVRGQLPGFPDSLTCAPTTTPMECFITSESDIDNIRERSRPRFRQQTDRRKAQNASHPSQAPNYWTSPTRAEGSTSSFSGVEQDILRETSRPDTPFLTGLSGPESALSSSSSRRSSIAVSSVEFPSSRLDDMAPSSKQGTTDGRGVEDSLVPQFIMPSLTVPRRRPFSDVGKSLGKLKVMVAGRAGIGKTSLIRSLAQRCEHIVHIDPLEPTGMGHAAEIYASSRPHPWWRADLDLATTIGRRRSLTGEMLDRNVCFVESQSQRNGLAPSQRDLHYVESHLNSLLTKPMDDSDLLALLNAGGESIVDVLLYLIPHEGLTSEDVDYIKNAQNMTNVIPLLARVDELGSDNVNLVKQKVTQGLVDQGLESFSFVGPDSLEDALQVFAVSSETQPDYDTMDASILMNSDYIEPLIPTDLGELVNQLFSLDGSARLRHSAAVKCIRWRRDHGSGMLKRVSQGRGGNPRFFLDPSCDARYFTHDRCWGRVDLYNWANNLRQSLHAERLAYLMANRSETVTVESQLVTLDLHDAKRSTRRRKRLVPRHQDPLGILELGGQLKQKGMLILEMLSSLGLIGFVVARLTQAEWTHGSPHGSLVRRVSIDVTGLGSLLS